MADQIEEMLIGNKKEEKKKRKEEEEEGKKMKNERRRGQNSLQIIELLWRYENLKKSMWGKCSLLENRMIYITWRKGTLTIELKSCTNLFFFMILSLISEEIYKSNVLIWKL